MADHKHNTVPRNSNSHIAWQTLTKVPRIAAIFWVVKLLTTALGESAADYSVTIINPYVAVIGGFLLLVMALLLQFKAKAYQPIAYWSTVAAVAVFGTMAADVLHIQFGISYAASTIFFAAAMIIMFTVWYKIEGTLSIHSIYTPQREALYWLTVMTTFALGTAAGDMAAISLNLGYLSSIGLFSILITIPALAYWIFKVNSVVTFWCAYVLTRPLGASIADWLGKPLGVGGVGLGDGFVTLALMTLIVIVVGHLATTHSDSQRSSFSSPPA